MAPKKTNPNFLNGVPELLILKLLSQREMYGYEIVKSIQVLSHDSISFGEGCIYPILHNLEKFRFLKSRKLAVNGRDRLYYKTTKTGIKRLKDLTDEWQTVVTGVESLLGESYA